MMRADGQMRAGLRRLGSPLLALALSACSPAQLLNATVPQGGLTVSRDVAYGSLPRQRLDIWAPRHAAPDAPVVVFFYGGSWKSGSKSLYPFVAATLARAGLHVIVPDYRLYPQVKYPTFLQDSAAAVAWVQAHPVQCGTGKLFLMGHSAGAYNAAMLAFDHSLLSSAGGYPGRIAGFIGLAGPYDFLPITDPDIKPIFPGDDEATQPITYAGPHAPPSLLLAGTADRTVRPRNSKALAARLKASGAKATLILYKGLGHIGLVTALAPAFQWRAPVLRDILAFVRRIAQPDTADGHAS